LSAAGAVLLAGCGTRPVRILAGDPSDVRILNAALEVERTQVAVYEVGAGLIAEPVVATILEHERAHLAAVEEMIRELGGAPPGARAAAEYRRGIPKTADAWRQHVIQLEEQWASGYEALIPKLANQRLRGTFGALATTEAEHAAALGTTR
jgi:rubrerythrin